MKIFFAVLIVALAADLIIKGIVQEFFSDETMTLIPHLLLIEYTTNDGISFGWFSGGGWWITGITILMILGLILYYGFVKRKNQLRGKKTHILFHISFALFLAGAFGNLIDRIVLGYVRDMIRFDFWDSFPTFNLADIFINIGAILIVIYFIFIDGKTKEAKIEDRNKS